MRRNAGNTMLVVGALMMGAAATAAATPTIVGTGHGRGPAAGAAQAQTVTGCLKANGDEKGEYAITDKDGKKYGLRSKTVALSKHVGHTVTVTGTMRKGDDDDEKYEKKSGSSEAGDLQVTALTMVSPTCQ
jgi:hypothetical protein